MDGQDATSISNNSGQQTVDQKQLQQTQAKVDEIVGIMRVNLENVMERDYKLGELLTFQSNI